MTPQSDALRVAEIQRLDVMGAGSRPDLGGIVELAARTFDAPMAAINLITDDAQRQPATFGLDASVSARENSMCAVVIEEAGAVVVPDASRDDRFCDHPFVAGQLGDVRFYASCKLVTLTGVVIGTLCVFDTEVRRPEETQVRALCTLADCVVDALELGNRSRMLARSSERLSSFAGQVSHDLKSPLAGIALSLGLADELLSEGAGVEESRRLLSRAIRGSERIADQIDATVAYQRGGRLTAGAVDLEKVVATVETDLGLRAAGVEIERGELPHVSGDEHALTTVVGHLVDNAVKHGRPEDGGTQPRVSVAVEQHAGTSTVLVVDHGRGVPLEDRQRIFDPRVRLDERVPGAGIGLDTCSALVHRRGGRIGVRETPGGGATFWFELP